MPEINIIFSYHINFSPKYGGAASRWIYEVLSRKSEKEIGHFRLLLPSNRVQALYEIEGVERGFVSSFANLVKRRIPFLKEAKKETIASYLWCRAVVKRLNQNQILIIENRLYYAPILRRLGYKGKIYVHLHNELFKKSSLQYLEKLDKSVDGLLSCCEAVLNPLKKSCPSLYAKGQVIYNGVDTALFYPKPQIKKDNVLLFVGRMVEQKGVHLLLEAYRKLLLKYPNLILKLAGSASFGGGRELTAYEKRIKKEVDAINERGGTVEMLGFVEHDIELPKLYSEATVFCVSSQYTEAFPMVIVEAMFCGTAVVAPRLGGIPEALPSDELIYPEANVAEMYNKLEQVLCDQDYRRQVEEENLNFAKQYFTWDCIRDRFEEILTKI